MNNRNTGTCRNCSRAVPCNSGNGRECAATMNRLRAVDFTLTELVLYLDAYPDSHEALKMYRKLVEERKQLIDAYESRCGAITMYGAGDTWNWTEGPWPWEAEAN